MMSCAQRIQIQQEQMAERITQSQQAKAMQARLGQLTSTVPFDSPAMGPYYESGDPADKPTSQPITPELVIRAASESGALLNPQLDNLLNSVSRADTKQLSERWIEDPTTGSRFLGRGNTTLPSGVNPAVAGKGAEPLSSEDGTTIGYRIPNGRGGFTIIRAPSSGEVQPFTINGNPIPGLYVDAATGKMIDTRSVMEKATGTSPVAAPAAGAAKGGAPAGGRLYYNPKTKKFQTTPP